MPEMSWVDVHNYSLGKLYILDMYTKMRYNVHMNIESKKQENIPEVSVLIEQIKRLSWELLSEAELEKLMVLSYFAAKEFAESLRIALTLHPTSLEFKQMAQGELNTNNLTYEKYADIGDHADFLSHFISEYKLLEKHRDVVRAGEAYLRRVRMLDDETRAMSVVSRERELPGIFARILESRNFSNKALTAFKYYLKEHIRLDSCEGGHADLLESYSVPETVAKFYQARIEMYRCLPTLFTQK
jgi:hypothetical protein